VGLASTNYVQRILRRRVSTSIFRTFTSKSTFFKNRIFREKVQLFPGRRRRLRQPEPDASDPDARPSPHNFALRERCSRLVSGSSQLLRSSVSLVRRALRNEPSVSREYSSGSARLHGNEQCGWISQHAPCSSTTSPGSISRHEFAWAHFRRLCWASGNSGVAPRAVDGRG